MELALTIIKNIFVYYPFIEYGYSSLGLKQISINKLCVREEASFIAINDN